MIENANIDRRSLLIGSAGALAAETLSQRALAQEPAIRVFTDRPTSPFPHYWEACVGSDRAIVVMRADWRRDLALAKERAGFKSVRFHGLFDDEMGVCRSIGPDGPVLDFFYVDQVFDAMLELGVRPFVELGFMPKVMASSQNSIFWYQANTSPPQKMADWIKLVSGLARHLLDRYGETEVLSWRFECWNEPNLSFWSSDQATYFELYAATARALKGVHAKLQVGGPATAQQGWIPEFIAFCATHNVPVDFISSHIYPDDPQINLFGRDLHLPHENVIPRALQETNAKIRTSSIPNLPLVISEWSSQNPAFIAQTVRDCAGLCDTFSYWTFSNVFEEHGPVPSYENELFGLLNPGGVARPSMHAFTLLHRLGTERIVSDDGPVLATRRADGSIAILAWNLYTGSDQPGHTGNPLLAHGGEAVNQGPTRVVTLSVAGGGRAATVTRVDAANDPAVALYRQMGKPASPTRQQLAALRTAGQTPRPTALAMRGGTVELTLAGNSLALIEFAAG